MFSVMSGKDLVKRAMMLGVCEETPWVPFVGVHGAYLIGAKASDYLKSKEMIVKGVSAAVNYYKPDGIPVLFDLQLEAEAMGCRVIWPEDNPPSVIGHPLAEGMKISDLHLPSLKDGRVGLVMSAAAELRELFPDIALYGLVTGPFTLALHLLGTEIFMKLLMDEHYVHELMRFCTDVTAQMSKYYIDTGCDVIAVVDPMVSQIGTEQFDLFVLPYLSNVFTLIKSKGALTSLFVCGDATHNIESMCNSKPDNISIDENISLEMARDICLRNKISIGGNLRLTTTLLLGDEKDCERDALECIDTGGKIGYIISPGCDLPYSTKIENLKAVSDVVKDDYRREVARTLTLLSSQSQRAEKISENEFSEISNVHRLSVDVITLDSSACAPCQYMMDAVSRACESFGERVVVKEHKIKSIEGLEMMKRLNVKKIPSICIDGKVLFSSVIPPVDLISDQINKILIQKSEL